jgi:hypothetical protein
MGRHMSFLGSFPSQTLCSTKHKICQKQNCVFEEKRLHATSFTCTFVYMYLI